MFSHTMLDGFKGTMTPCFNLNEVMKSLHEQVAALEVQDTSS